jgi:cell wall-associated NlpC family hydrolase
LRDARPVTTLAAKPLLTRPEVGVTVAYSVPRQLVAQTNLKHIPAAPLVATTTTSATVSTVSSNTPPAPVTATLVAAQPSKPEPAKVVVATAPKTPGTKPDDKVLLAQLDAELRATETQLKSTDDKLSDGQRQLLGLSNTLRSVMLEDQDAVGLHPFVRVASRYAGTPYVWGGESRYGFDCSGFIIRVMRDLGYKALPHSAAEQFKYGQPVAQAMLRPGDLVFFANTYKPGISHVGIYIGKRRFIHAASTRLGTIVSSLDTQPYSRKYAGGRRLVAVGRRA